MTQQYRLACMAAWLSSTGISHRDLLSHIPSIHFSAVSSSPRPGIAPQSLTSSSQLLHLRGELCPYQGYIWLWQGLILIPFRVPQISCFTLSLKCFSSDPDNCPQSGDETPASVPPPAEGRSRPTDTPVFPPSSFCVVLHTLFQWSGIPVCSQLVFCKHLCVSRCIPDVSVERDVLHIHLFLLHLVLPFFCVFLPPLLNIFCFCYVHTISVLY